MSFLTPLFLLALGALAVPVLIHLTQKERKHVVAFPSLMFLRKIPYESVQRRRIRDAFLLLLRLAALALIVAAFARPFLRGAALDAGSLAGDSGDQRGAAGPRRHEVRTGLETGEQPAGRIVAAAQRSDRGF